MFWFGFNVFKKKKKGNPDHASRTPRLRSFGNCGSTEAERRPVVVCWALGEGAQAATAEGAGLSPCSGGKTRKPIAQLCECPTNQIEHETDELHGV